MSQVIGVRTTNAANNETRIIRQVDDEIALLEPNEAPLITLLNRLKYRKAVKSPVWEWYEDDYCARWGTNGNDTVTNSTSSTTIVVADGTVFVVGDLFVVPKVVTSSTAPEMCRVTAVSGNTLTVVRDVGSAGVDYINADAPLRLCGSAHEEKGSLPNAKTTAPSLKTTYLQIFRTVIDFSNTAIATDTYGSPQGDRAREHRKKLKEHKIAMNSALLFGRASQAMAGGPNNRPIRTTQGLLSTIATNITDASGTLTKKAFEGFSRQAFRYGSQTKVLLAAPTVKSALNEWAREFLLIKPSETKYGVNIQQVETAHGMWLLVNDWMLESQGSYGFGATALSVDLEQIKYLYLSNNGVNRDTAIHEDVVQDGTDGKTDEILTEGGFAIGQEKFHARLYNVTDYS